MTIPRIGINLSWLLPEQAGGAEEYTVRLLRALEGASGVEITLLCNRRFPTAHPELTSRFEVAVAPIDGRSRVARIAIESTWLVREVRRRRLHLVHHLNNVVPLIRTDPSVVTIHDLRPVLMPQTLGAAHGAYLRARFGPSVRHASVITTPSRYVRGTVIDTFDAEPSRVVVVSAPVAPRPLPAVDPGARVIGRPFFLYPAITNPHKNHLVLVEAFARVAAAHDDVELVLTGAEGPAEGDIVAAIARLHLHGRVRRPGRIPADALDRLFRTATALVYPSRYEGFGLPLAEAMAARCPVIAADATALPEVAADAGVLVPPDDVDGWADAMIRMLDDDAFRASCIEAGTVRVRAFTSEETLRRQMDAYRMATGHMATGR